jgi:hypothetical protein
VIPFYQNENHYLITSRKNCCFVSNEAQIYAYVQHELDKRGDLLKCKSIGSKDTVNATVVAGKVPGFKYYKVKGR